MSENILETIAESTRERVREAKGRISYEELAKKAFAMNCDTGFPFERALREGDVSFICECKKASPSKGVIAEDFPYLDIATDYERAGAAAISVLTEPKWFMGSDAILKEIAENVTIPVLRKDFTVDEYMILEAKVLGASAVLLICAIMSGKEIKSAIGLCDRLGLSALVEAHDEAEIGMAVRAGARIIGVNNRNLKDFTVDIRNSERLRRLVPKNVLFVSESGIKTGDDIDVLRKAGVNAVLIGETLMRAADKKKMLARLKGRRPRVKLCGMRRIEDIDYCNEFKPDYAGMIMSPGFKRSVDVENARRLKAELDPDIRMTGVYVNEPIQNITAAVRGGIIDMIQLHGAEDERYITELRSQNPGVQIIKAFKLQSPADVKQAIDSNADFVLLDSGTGSGKAFDWELLKLIPDRLRDRCFLAGGLNPGNVGEALTLFMPFAVDTSSGTETEGVKDREKIRDFVFEARKRNGILQHNI
jgi:indole-3-glycerol phosphate synthase/phosphoribosylanthranilate isomerase